MNERKINTQDIVQGAVAVGASLITGLEIFNRIPHDPTLDLLTATTVYTICGVPINAMVNVINEKIDHICYQLLH